ncbi:hypothetical protein FNL55_03115 [Tardiphaga sp. vice352]|nr:hypothetical protein FNL53_03055 [Tardiphaga sp. vice278]QDM20161.1 hypothetical protein FIU28_02560 [Tardiphaga sp. vice154]QDM25234.1 hypothetical protein FNL56_03020 [Tardiphaga sp. vice304]QDM30445.1 hypothetical protein FNL55_03115 [Tardiphaga sp. vice352]
MNGYNLNDDYRHLLGEVLILYFGTPVVLISSMNEDTSINLAPEVCNKICQLQILSTPTRTTIG